MSGGIGNGWSSTPGVSSSASAYSPASSWTTSPRRFAHCRANGVEGVIARTDWEVISDGSVFDTLNLANLTGFARLARGTRRPAPQR